MVEDVEMRGSSFIDIGLDVQASQKMTLGGLEWLKKKRGKKADVFTEDITDTIDMITAMVVSANPMVSPDELRKKVAGLPAEDLEKVVAKLPGDEERVGNEVTGNLTEAGK